MTLSTTVMGSNKAPIICTAQITDVQRLGLDVDRVLLKPDQPLDWQAGQYLEIAVGESVWAPFSIACAPGAEQLELHIQYLPGRETSEAIAALLQPGQTLRLRVASGDCFLAGTDRPLLLVAAGTGFAQMKAIVEAAWQQGWRSPITLYWAARNAAGLYALSQAQAWQQEHPGFTLIPMVELADARWQGRVGRITEVLAADFIGSDVAARLEGFISGSPAMVYAVEDLLMSRGMAPKALHSDVHAYAPRDYLS
ncbi:hypothetical protein [Marinospirillum alkaliphilum]|uniref:CDP-4-dehydro-6-deoxyglucose reductase n=1 Tax=Marinospirillum alkaliphilum DSM 21637 TaxID=1122209 RepID=A0A1K1V760_9GAMM|nr:hypothetical protein [Marinospirillum alkaliphilum]SFX20389.1 CDP-4-dehydro-6-deoxyglucose reductase [Marinospirillum alkaliphilum DSM 21637]